MFGHNLAVVLPFLVLVWLAQPAARPRQDCSPAGWAVRACTHTPPRHNPCSGSGQAIRGGACSHKAWLATCTARPATAPSCECASVVVKAASRRSASRRGLGCPVSRVPADSLFVRPRPRRRAFCALRGGARSLPGVLTPAASTRVISFHSGVPLCCRHPVCVAV